MSGGHIVQRKDPLRILSYSSLSPLQSWFSFAIYVVIQLVIKCFKIVSLVTPFVCKPLDTELNLCFFSLLFWAQHTETKSIFWRLFDDNATNTRYSQIFTPRVQCRESKVAESLMNTTIIRHTYCTENSRNLWDWTHLVFLRRKSNH